MELTPPVAYLTGFIIGDGNVSGKSGGEYLVRAVEENENFINSFADSFGQVFGQRPKVYFDRHNNSYVAWLHSKRVWECFVNELKVPSGDKSTIVRVPDWVKQGDAAVKVAFLRGLFDAEGSVVPQKYKSGGNVRISFKVDNQALGADVFEMLKELGMDAKLHNYNYARESMAIIQINGKVRCKQFLEKVGFNHPAKMSKLVRLV